MEIDRPLLDLFRRLAPLGLGPRFRRGDGGFLPAVDVFDRDGDLVIRFELPGIDPAKDVWVTLEEGELMVKGERREEKEVKEKGYHRHETSYGAFERHVPVPADTQESDVKAEYKSGVLEVTVPRAAKATAKPAARAIPIKTASAKPSKN
jgi:HSP20 family protein